MAGLKIGIEIFTDKYWLAQAVSGSSPVSPWPFLGLAKRIFRRSRLSFGHAQLTTARFQATSVNPTPYVAPSCL
jgi:hypothetical protein